MTQKNSRFLVSLILAAVLLVFSVGVPAMAAVPERPSNQYVLDSAGVLSEDTEKEIIRKNETLFKDTGAQLVVAAVDFLDGESIEDYTYDMFNIWGVGSSDYNNGILLVLAIGEDNYYAQAGYGIDTYFDGAKLSELLNDYLEADFASGNYDAGVMKFFNATYSELETYSHGNTPNIDEDYEEYGGSSHFRGSVLSTFFTVVLRIIIAVVIVVVVLAIIRSIGGGGGGGYGGGGGGGHFWTGMFLGNMMGGRRNRWRGPPPGGFGGPRPPRGGGGFGGFGGGGFSGGGRSGGGGSGRSGGFSGGGRSGGFSGGGRTHGGGAGRR